ncbi:hypothetical protein [Rickettsia sp. Tenjiku01]|uniref:hypothetical protein n=1 Tax=Rickettsia sp. Tenjiku01 TaxID=1736693 RepID=UPI0007DB31E5|nr:hypothetical protein [Rickettsia sp. Tenjiku01]
MRNKENISNIILDAEENALLESFENDEWQRIKNFEQEKHIAQVAAANDLKKDTRINIRISSSDLMRIKQKAAYEGLPYQILLHKYSAGHG